MIKWCKSQHPMVDALKRDKLQARKEILELVYKENTPSKHTTMVDVLALIKLRVEINFIADYLNKDDISEIVVPNFSNLSWIMFSLYVVDITKEEIADPLQAITTYQKELIKLFEGS